MSGPARPGRRRAWLRMVIAGVLVLVVAVVGALAFEPWTLWTDEVVAEPAPTAEAAPEIPTEAAPETPTVTPTGAPADARQAETLQPEPSTTPEPRDIELAVGDLEAAEHATSGTVRVLRLADGRRFVRLEALSTSNGPDLHVWVTDQPSGGSWGSYDDGRYVRLGPLKGNQGDQNYEVPPEADLRGMTSVVIWCDRFNVAFGTAPVRL